MDRIKKTYIDLKTILSPIRNRELGEVYWAESIRGFALGLLNVFIPIYLIKIGYSVQSVVVMYFIESLWHVIFVIPAAKLACRSGFKKTNFFSTFIYIVFLILLYTIQQYHWPLAFLAIISETGSIFYAIWYHMQMARTSEKSVRGTQIGFKNLIAGLAALPAPLIGGIILSFFGIQIMIAMVSSLLIMSTLPLFFADERHIWKDLSFRDMVKDRPTWRPSLVFATQGIDNMLNSFVWPIFIFFFILHDNFAILGFVLFLTSLFSLITNVLVGMWVEGDREKALGWGAGASFFIWISKTFIRTTTGVYIVDSINGLAQELIGTAFNAKSYDIANGQNQLSYLMYREILIHTGRLALYTSIFFMTLIHWPYVFFAGAFIYLLYFLF